MKHIITADTYLSPEIEVLEIETEQTFATSDYENENMIPRPGSW